MCPELLSGGSYLSTCMELLFKGYKINRNEYRFDWKCCLRGIQNCCPGGIAVIRTFPEGMQPFRTWKDVTGTEF